MQASRLIRRLRGLARVPIIFLTAKDAPADIIQGIQAGARHYVTKPFKMFDLSQKIKKILAE
jgi:DNA-binding response OmpR family regulator